MKHLSSTLPAETYFLIHGKDTSLRELLKYTFMDLMLKQVLEIKKVEQQTHPKDPVQGYQYVLAGKNLPSYSSQPHEEVFLSIYRKNNDSKVLFRHLVKMGYENSKSKERYQSKIVDSSNLQEAFSRTIFQKLLGGATYTARGNELKTVLAKELEELDAVFPTYLKDDHAKALEILKLVGGNIFLLQNVDFDLLNQVDKSLLLEMEDEKRYVGGTGCTSCGVWYSDLGHHSDTFDSSCSSDSGCSSHSGGSGCSSCSGCSGCGGCGGCGS